LSFTAHPHVKQRLLAYQEEERKVKAMEIYTGETVNCFEHPFYKYSFWHAVETLPFCFVLTATMNVYFDIGTPAALTKSLE